MVSTTEKQGELLGFLSLYEIVSREGYIGALLITDLQGVPQEFRCTHPVKPTAIQRPLYGDVLMAYIGVRLCGLPLLESVQSKPSLLVLHQPHLIDVAKESLCPVVLVRKSGEAIDVAVPASEKPSRRERIDCPTGRFQPIILESHPDHENDVAFARDIFDRVFSYLDPLEPFERMAKAIEVLSKQDKRFQ